MTSENNTGKPNLTRKYKKMSETHKPSPKIVKSTFHKSDTNVEKQLYPVLVIKVLLDEDIKKTKNKNECQKEVVRNISENGISGDTSCHMDIGQKEKQAESLPSFESAFRVPRNGNLKQKCVQKRPRKSKKAQFLLTSIKNLCDKSTQTDMWHKDVNLKIRRLPTYEEAIKTKKLRTSMSDLNDEERDIINMVANWETELENAYASNSFIQLSGYMKPNSDSSSRN